MNTTEDSSVHVTTEQTSTEQHQDREQSKEPKIRGFDASKRSLLKEPSLYLSIVVIFLATFLSLDNSPMAFWLTFGSMSAVAILFHALAERVVFSSKKGFKRFEVPFDGVFVIALGSVLPGLGLLAYSANSFATMKEMNIGEELSKIILIVVVPVFNFLVWSAVRKGYLLRPRLTGLMNGLALGLAASWTTIWLKTILFGNSDSACKFGWMLLLFASPFMMFSSICLGRDLWYKTEERIGRIAATFSGLGALLSLSFVFMPLVNMLPLQSLLTDARQGSTSVQEKAIATLRNSASIGDLRPSVRPISGLNLAEMLIPNRGLDSGSQIDQDLYFRITGRQYADVGRDDAKVAEEGKYIPNPIIGSMMDGLSLAKSQITGNIDATTYSSAIDWTLTFHNSHSSAQEASCEIAIPKGAVVSRATLWVNGQPKEAAFGGTGAVRSAYQSVVDRQRDPLLVTMSGPDRVLVQCFPVPAYGGEMRIRIGMKAPLETKDGKVCSVTLPKLLASNFAQPKRNHISLTSKDAPIGETPGIAVSQTDGGFALNGIIKNLKDKARSVTVTIKRSAEFTEFVTPDWYSPNKEFIVERLQEVKTSAPKRLFVVIDSSASLRKDAGAIGKAMTEIPAEFNPLFYLAGERHSSDEEESEAVSLTLKQIESILKPETFVGGQDNTAVLREVLETAADTQGSAVVWIHGPQPLSPNMIGSSLLDLVHSVDLYDLQVAAGPVPMLQALQMEDSTSLVKYVPVHHNSTGADLKDLLVSWEKPTTYLAIQRRSSATKPDITFISDRAESAQVTCLWAKDQVSRLLSSCQQEKALEIAKSYRLVSAVSGAVVLDGNEDYAKYALDPGSYKDRNSTSSNETYRGLHQWFGSESGGGGLVGAPVDPRFGQSNEVGQLADYGYDTMRDVSRVVTALSFLISTILGMWFLRSRKSINAFAIGKAVGLVVAVPLTVHLLGTFMINNFGGLGGGL